MDSQSSTSSWKRTLLRGCFIALSLAFWAECYNVFLGSNFRVVIPGKIYRCSQPSGKRLQSMIDKYDIRTVVNLRGCCDPYEWYMDEVTAGHQAGISHEDLTFSAKHLPSVHEIRHLVEIIDRTEKPIVFHCFRGIDRTGLAATTAKLLLTDCSLSDALDQLRLRYGYVNAGPTRHLRRFFGLYSEWLDKKQWEHSSDRFREWAKQYYIPDSCRCELELLDHDSHKVHIPQGKPIGLKVQVTNTSLRPWNFSATENAGFHLGWQLYDLKDYQIDDGRSGLYEDTINPGESRVVTVILPGQKAGTYSLQIDMLEEQHCYFRQVGGEPLDVEVVVE